MTDKNKQDPLLTIDAFFRRVALWGTGLIVLCTIAAGVAKYVEEAWSAASLLVSLGLLLIAAKAIFRALPWREYEVRWTDPINSLTGCVMSCMHVSMGLALRVRGQLRELAVTNDLTSLEGILVVDRWVTLLIGVSGILSAMLFAIAFPLSLYRFLGIEIPLKVKNAPRPHQHEGDRAPDRRNGPS